MELLSGLRASRMRLRPAEPGQQLCRTLDLHRNADLEERAQRLESDHRTGRPNARTRRARRVAAFAQPDWRLLDQSPARRRARRASALKGRTRTSALRNRRRKAKADADAVPGVDQSDRGGEIDRLLLGERGEERGVSLVARAFFRRLGQRLRPGERRSLAFRKDSRLAPHRDQIELFRRDAQLAQEIEMK